jgi:hypothetical protein
MPARLHLSLSQRKKGRRARTSGNRELCLTLNYPRYLHGEFRMKNTTTGGDGNNFGVLLALIVIIAGGAVFFSTVGPSRAMFLIERAFRR